MSDITDDLAALKAALDSGHDIYLADECTPERIARIVAWCEQRMKEGAENVPLAVQGVVLMPDLRQAAQDIIDYKTTGAPDFLEWDEKFEALRAALASPQPPTQGSGWKCSCGANLYIDSDGAPKSRAWPTYYGIR